MMCLNPHRVTDMENMSINTATKNPNDPSVIVYFFNGVSK